MHIALLVSLALQAAAGDCAPPITQDGRVVTEDGVALALPVGFDYTARGAWPRSDRPRAGPAPRGGWIYTATASDGSSVEASIGPRSPISADDLRNLKAAPGGEGPRETPHGCVATELGEPSRLPPILGDGFDGRVLVACPDFSVNVKARSGTASAVRDLLRAVADTVRKAPADTLASHRRGSAEAQLVGCFRVASSRASTTSIRCLDAGGGLRSRREEEATSRPRGPGAPPVDLAWRAGTWASWNGNVLLCSTSELGFVAQYGPALPRADGYAFRDELWTRVAANVDPPTLAERPFEPGPGRVDAELPLPASLGWDDTPEQARRKLAPTLRFVSEHREDARTVVHTYAGTWSPGITSDRIDLQFRDGRISGASLFWSPAKATSPSRTWEELIARVAAGHGSPHGNSNVKEVWAQVLKRDTPTARGRRLLGATPEIQSGAACEPGAEPMSRKPVFPAGADPYALLDAVVRGEREDFLVSRWDLISSWSFRREAGVVVALFAVPPAEARENGGVSGPLVLLGLTAPK